MSQLYTTGIDRDREGLFHLHSAGPLGGPRFLASVRVHREAEQWLVTLLAGSCFAEHRLRAAELESGLGTWLVKGDGHYRVPSDQPVVPGELCSILGVLGLHWRSTSGATLYQVLMSAAC